MSSKRIQDEDARRRAANRKAKREAEDPEPHACEQCGRAARGRFCYWCGKRRGLW
jgi:hypothetical protein